MIRIIFTDIARPSARGILSHVWHCRKGGISCLALNIVEADPGNSRDRIASLESRADAMLLRLRRLRAILRVR